MGRWLRRNWWLIPNNGSVLTLAIAIMVMLWDYAQVVGMVVGLFLLQYRAANTLIMLTWRAARDHLINLRELDRRMTLIFGGQAIVLLGLIFASVFAETRWVALLPGIKLPVRVFAFFKSRSVYRQQPAGEYFQKGKYD